MIEPLYNVFVGGAVISGIVLIVWVWSWIFGEMVNDPLPTHVPDFDDDPYIDSIDTVRL